MLIRINILCSVIMMMIMSRLLAKARRRRSFAFPIDKKFLYKLTTSTCGVNISEFVFSSSSHLRVLPHNTWRCLVHENRYIYELIMWEKNMQNLHLCDGFCYYAISVGPPICDRELEHKDADICIIIVYSYLFTPYFTSLLWCIVFHSISLVMQFT